MSLTQESLVNQAIALAAKGLSQDESKIYVTDVDLLVQHAMEDLADTIAKDERRRGMLIKTFTPLTIDSTTGIGDLSVSAYDDLKREHLGKGTIFDADSATDPLWPINAYQDLLRPQPTIYGYYCLFNNKIYTRQRSTGSLVATNGPLTINAIFVPVAATVPADLIPHAIEKLALRILAQQPSN
jgi:hypothetical protein